MKLNGSKSEPNLVNQSPRDRQRGSIEVITGSMFSGKTEELIRRLKRARIARFEVAIFKPALDERFSKTDVVSHSAQIAEAVPVYSAGQIYHESQSLEVIGIDEAQFFDGEIVEVVERLANEGKRVVLAGLDMDFAGKPFGMMPQLMARAETVTKVQAVCMQCGHAAHYSYRLTDEAAKVVLGAEREYEPRCRECFLKGSNLRIAPVDLFSKGEQDDTKAFNTNE